MRKTVLLLVFAAFCSIANAAITAELAPGFPQGGGGVFNWVYEVELDQDSRLDTDTGPQLFVIYDFAGYINGSIFTPSADWVGTTQDVGPVPAGIAIMPPFPADTNTVNLVFTYNGPELPGPSVLGLFGAQSRFGQQVQGTQAGQSTNNTPTSSNGNINGNIDFVPVPTGQGDVIPEPGTMVLLGSALLGLGIMRGRRK